jgi:UDP-glucuronate 4-epimerase
MWFFTWRAKPVCASWGASFETYLNNNVLRRQRLPEGVKSTAIHRFIYASSSSIYGDADAQPIVENTPPRPVSPYGVTKLAGEHLCSLYAANFGVPTTQLRYFTVYGPRQRPDMAFHKLIRNHSLSTATASKRATLPMYGM